MVNTDSSNGMNGTLTEPRFILSMAIIVLAVVYDMLITFFHPAADAHLVGAVFGALNTGGFAVAVQFWIGSSASSREKDTTIKNLSDSK